MDPLVVWCMSDIYGEDVDPSIPETHLDEQGSRHVERILYANMESGCNIII